MKIKKIVLIFLILETLDIITTLVGINYFGHREVNPLAIAIGLDGLMVLKIISVLVIATFMQRMNLKWLSILVTVIIGLPIVWNIIMILT